MERVQSEYTRRELAPLADWKVSVHPASKHTWAGLYYDPRAHNLVRSYINKVPALATRKA